MAREPRVFISYRTKDTQQAALRLAGDLKAACGDEAIFIDNSGIEAGDSWDAMLRAEAEAATVTLVLIGEDWLLARRKNGVRRLDEPGDWVRLEIEAALTHGKAIPILVDEAEELGEDSALPEPLRPLQTMQASRLRAKDWVSDLDNVVRLLEGEGFKRKVAVESPPRRPRLTPEQQKEIDELYQQRDEATDSETKDRLSATIAARKQKFRERGTLSEGDTFGEDHRFYLVEECGRGAFGQVWRAFDRLTQEDVAIKVLFPHFVSDDTVDRFRRGAERLNRLDHPNIVRLIQPVGLEHIWHYFVMEFVEEGDLFSNRELSPEAQRKVLIGAAEALHFAHQCDDRLIHRDIKPPNILIGQGHRGVLADFDFVRAADSLGFTVSGQRVGTFDFGAPEVWQRGQEATAKSDQFSLAATFAWVLLEEERVTGFAGRAASLLEEGSLPRHETRALLRALSNREEDRFETVADFLEAFSTSREAPGTAAPASRARRGTSPGSVAGRSDTSDASTVSDWADVGDDVAVDPDTGLPESVTDRATGIEMILIPAGTYLRGAPADDDMAYDDERPQHEVTISKPFYLGKYPVTNAQYRLFVSGHDSKAYDGLSLNGEQQPAVYVSWNKATAFCERFGFRLPTEAQWEYACRAGTTTRFPWGDDPDDGAGWANCADQTAKSKYPGWTTFSWEDGYIVTSPVGAFRANAFGLCDMIGNVWEWCSDRWKSSEYERHADGVTEPQGPVDGTGRLLRGGSWGYGPGFCRSSFRYVYGPTDENVFVGFRVSRAP